MKKNAMVMIFAAMVMAGCIGGTQSDLTPAPSVISSSPTGTNVSVATTEITVSFNQRIYCGSSTLFSITADDFAVSGNARCSGFTMTFTLSSALTYSTSYTVSAGGVENSVERASEIFSWSFTTEALHLGNWEKINSILISGDNIFLVGEDDGGYLKIESRLLSNPSTIQWSLSPTGIQCRYYNSNGCGKSVISQEDNEVFVYAFGISATPYQIGSFISYDLAWKMLKISSTGEIIWQYKSDQTFQDSDGEYPTSIAVNGDAVFVLGDHGVILPDRTRRLEKINKFSGKLIWLSIDSSIWPSGLAIDETGKSYIAGSGVNYANYYNIDHYWIMEMADADGGLLWKKTSNQFQSSEVNYVDDEAAKMVSFYNNNIYVSGSQGRSHPDSIAWRIEKRSPGDGSVVGSHMTAESGESLVSAQFVDDAGMYVSGMLASKATIQKYDHNLNELWSKTFEGSEVAAFEKVGNKLYSVIKDTADSWLLEIIID